MAVRSVSRFFKVPSVDLFNQKSKSKLLAK